MKKPRARRGFLWSGHIILSGVAPPNPPFFFSLQKKTLRAAPCRPHPAGGLCKKLAPRAAVRRTNLFLSGHFTTFFQELHPLPALLFFIAKKVSKK
ncbi:hypothetical protein, partial [Candidatus Avelusimicrobium faecicola]|uniref:hypothetical protein n=1 Tax=Candidatus Avelusimicrobium faecicola TaxID=3416205 RepID=UPI003D0D0E01